MVLTNREIQKQTNGCFTALQQQRSLVPTLGVDSLRSYPGQLADTTQRDTTYISSCACVPQPDRRGTHQSAVSMHD